MEAEVGEGLCECKGSDNVNTSCGCVDMRDARMRRANNRVSSVRVQGQEGNRSSSRRYIKSAAAIRSASAAGSVLSTASGSPRPSPPGRSCPPSAPPSATGPSQTPPHPQSPRTAAGPSPGAGSTATSACTVAGCARCPRQARCRGPVRRWQGGRRGRRAGVGDDDGDAQGSGPRSL